MKAVIDRAGRIVVPKPLRQALGLKPGQPLEIRAGDGRLEIENPSNPLPRFFSCIGVEAIPIYSRPSPTRVSDGLPGFSPRACRNGLGTTILPARSMTAFMACTMP